MKFSSAAPATADHAPPGKNPPKWEAEQTVEIVCWSGSLAQLLAILRMSKSSFEDGLKGKSHIRRQGSRTSVLVSLRNNAPLFAALRRKLSDAASE